MSGANRTIATSGGDRTLPAGRSAAATATGTAVGGRAVAGAPAGRRARNSAAAASRTAAVRRAVCTGERGRRRRGIPRGWALDVPRYRGRLRLWTAKPAVDGGA